MPRHFVTCRNEVPTQPIETGTPLSFYEEPPDYFCSTSRPMTAPSRKIPFENAIQRT
jgi:hypothetical protein